ncbi:glycerophosphodiester phosphodiesterase [Oceanobacillus neutriphilus]|uniref:Glycerophosphoryl diester phosphodiesterase n=1 Tax=Oceanobacillus neutriphilus TaxID=531815 RepID=A0ABQ2P3F7_9BACI|nr:glycerophosphodiester phosphodiesterase [Oceanobacillus neutriphilus]GGP17327.1 glycerophosphoryl diester phosphodiesterase [Oceanobacillus neutriphilus]
MKKSIFLLISIIIILVLLIFFAFKFSEADADDKSNLLDSDSFIYIAHRGASGQAPEHTMTSYQQAKELGADYIEIDLQMTKDKQLIAMHDDTVNRTTDGSGAVNEMTLDEIKELDAGSWFNEENPDYIKEEYIGASVPSLREIFEEFGDEVNYYIETKEPEDTEKMEEALYSLLKEYNLIGGSVDSSKVVIQSYSAGSLLKMKDLDDSIPLIQLQRKEQIEEMDSLEKFEEIGEYAIGLGPNFSSIDIAYVQNAETAGLLIHPYTPNEPVEISGLKSWGVNGVFTNFAESYVEAMKTEIP